MFFHFTQKDDNEGWLVPPIRERWKQQTQEPPEKKQKTDGTGKTMTVVQLPKEKTVTVTTGVEE